MVAMASKIYLLFIVLAISSGCHTAQKSVGVPTVSYGKVIRISELNSAYVDPRPVDVWLPPDFNEKNRYAVIYMYDGQMLFDSTTTWNHQEWKVDETLQKLSGDTTLEKVIIVGIWNAGKKRHSEYFPQKPLQLIPKNIRDSITHNTIRPHGYELFDGPVYSDSLLMFIVRELKPYIDKSYPTLPDAASTYIMGSSMGGLMSMYAICEYPGVFSRAACLSTHWPGIFNTDNNPVPGAFLSYLGSNLPDHTTHSIYFDYGTETLDTMYARYQVLADTIMSKGGYHAGNWKTLKFEGDDHSEVAWARRLEIPLRFLLRKGS